MDFIDAVLDQESLIAMQKEVHNVYISEIVYKYILELITATRVHHYLEKGASPRGTIALVKMARAAAWVDGRDFVTPDDVKSQFPYVASHRIVPNVAARMENIQKEHIMAEIMKQVRKPPMGEGGR